MGVDDVWVDGVLWVGRCLIFFFLWVVFRWGVRGGGERESAPCVVVCLVVGVCGGGCLVCSVVVGGGVGGGIN